MCYRRFGPAVYSTKEQQEQRIIYTKILEFEQETVSWKACITIFECMDGSVLHLY